LRGNPKMSASGPLSVDDIIRFLENEKELYGPFSATIPKGNLSEVKILIESETEKPSVSVATDSTSKQTPQTLEEKLNACTTLDELRALCEQAVELRTDLAGTNLVFGVGNPEADLMLIGEAPGEQEDKEGEPFVGAAGQLLNKILAAINFDRDDVYIANILKHRPPGNRNPTPEECWKSLPYLMHQIDLVHPKIILCLGKISVNTLLNRDNTLGSQRGNFYPFRGVELTATYHPAALLRNPQWKRPTWEDVQKVRKRYDELGCKP
jgi:uracil-DNA glycosylase